MLIIFGAQNKQKITDEGEFHCPYCEAERHYQRKENRMYFSLYFIPLVPMGGGSEIIECTTCHRAFGVDVLSDEGQAFYEEKKKRPESADKPKRQSSAAYLLNNAEDTLRSGEPLEYVVRDITAAGINFDVAMNAVEPFLRHERAYCENCGLNYISGVEYCKECAQTLVKKSS